MQEHDTFWVLDSTKIATYQQCPRSYLFKFMFGWSPTMPSVHLQFGIAWHEAMEHLLLNGMTADALLDAIDKFEATFNDGYVQFLGDDHPTKNIANAVHALTEYVRLYQSDATNFEVLATEIAGKVHLDDDKTLYFRMDTMCNGTVMGCPPGYFSLEHKTGTSLNRVWRDQWLQKTQVGTYEYVLRCLYPEHELRGVCINGVFPHTPPKLKANGEPYANSKDVEFERLLVSKSGIQMEDWYLTTLGWYNDIIRDTKATLAASPDDPVLVPFRKQPEHCTSYFGCPYMAYCQAWPNPVGRADEPQAGFSQAYWNPQTLLEGAKKVVEV